MVDLSPDAMAEITAIKATRSLSDPIVGKSAPSAVGPAEHVLESIHSERMGQAMDTPTDEPIKKAGWTETAFAFSSVSLAASLTPEATDMYQWAFRKFLEDVRGVESAELPPFAAGSPPDEHVQHRLEDVRKRLKVARDKWYLENEYEADCAVPKTFWTEWHSGPASRNEYDPLDYEIMATQPD